MHIYRYKRFSYNSHDGIRYSNENPTTWSDMIKKLEESEYHAVEFFTSNPKLYMPGGVDYNWAMAVFADVGLSVMIIVEKGNYVRIIKVMDNEQAIHALRSIDDWE